MITRDYKIKKVCKHVVRYEATLPGAPASDVYVSKETLGTEFPEEIKITFDFGD